MALGEALWHRLGSLLGLTATSYDAGLNIPVQGSDNKLYRISASTLLAEVSADVVPRAVVSRSLTTAPGAPTANTYYIVAGTGGAWSGFTIGDIVKWDGSAWSLQTAPASGMLVYDEGGATNVQYRSGAWTPIDAVGSGTSTYWTLPAIGGAIDGDTFADEGATVPIDFGIEVQDEGVSQGTGIVSLNAVGSGIAVSVAGNEATFTVGGGAAPPSYSTITIGAVDVVAPTTEAAVEFIAGTGITLTPDTETRTVTFAATAAGDTFKTIAVSGQSNVVADSTTDTLTLAASGGAAITTDAGTDTITIEAAAASHTHNPALVLTNPLIVSATAQTITVATETTIDLDTEVYDPDANYTISADGEITCAAAGTYVSLLLANIGGSANSTQSPGTVKVQDNAAGTFADVASAQYAAMALVVYGNSACTVSVVGKHVLDAGEKIRFRCTPTTGYSNSTIYTGSRALVFRLATTGD